MMVVCSRAMVTATERKKTGQRKIRKKELIGLNLGTGYLGGKGGREKSNIIPKFLNLTIEGIMYQLTVFFPFGNIYKVLKLLVSLQLCTLI